MYRNSLSVEENLEPTKAWLQNRLRLDQKVLVAVVVVDAELLVVAIMVWLVSGL